VYATATLPTSGTTGTCPSVTTTGTNRLLLHAYYDWTASTTVTPNAADTERYDAFDSNTNFAVELATTVQAAAGASGTSSATFGSATFGGLAVTVALAGPSAATPVADFTATPLTGTWPLSVAFTDTSTNTPTSWAWTFGDSGTSSSQNPTHNYAVAGTYTVTLVATNAAGSDTETKTNYVTVANPSGTFTKIKFGAGLDVTDEGAGVIRVDGGGGGGTPPDATTTSKGIVQLAGDLAGTAASPQIAAGVIVDADINTAAAIGVAKLAPGSNGQVLTTVAGASAWATPAAGADNLDGGSPSSVYGGVTSIDGGTP
jgi:PKD repeat protein